MVFHWILLAIGAAGFGIAGYLDLKTTEFPDWLPYSLIILALGIRAAFAFWLGDFSILIDSMVVGIAFLGFGLLLYFLKQWGDGDAWLLGALGFLFPNASGFGQIVKGPEIYPFPIVQLFNFFFISFCYLIVYSVAIGFRYKGTRKKFFRSLKKDSRPLAALIVVFTFAVLSIVWYLNAFYDIAANALYALLLSPVLLAGILLFVRYGRFVESTIFKRKINVRDLRVGDVPVSEKWRVLTAKEVSSMKRKGGTVWIKEGVRFAPVFIITMLVSLFYGNLMLLFLI